MLGILAVHSVERSLGGSYWANPAGDWPSLGTRMRQWRPASGGAWDIVANPVRWLGWLGDLAPSLFVLATGYLLLRAARGTERSYLRDVAHRLGRFLPMFWIVFVAAAALAAVTGRDTPSPGDAAFWLSLVGFRATRATIYYGAGAWWYVGFLVQLAFLAPLLVRFLAPAPSVRRRAWGLLGAAIALKLVLLLALSGTSELDPVNRGGVVVGKLPELAAGLLLGVLVRGAADPRLAVRRLLRLPMSALALVVGFLAAFTLGGNAFAGVLFALGAAGVCAHVVTDAAAVVVRGLTFVARHSLAIFLAHPIATQLSPLGPVPLDGKVALRIAAAIVLGVVCGLALERAYDVVARLVRAALRRGGASAARA